MFGGEFCGNATRSVIQLLTGGNDYNGTIEVSGVDKPLNFTVQNGSIGVEMPLPRYGSVTTSVREGILVQLDGIAQLVVTASQTQNEYTPRELLNKLLGENAYELTNQPAVGISYFNPVSSQAEFAVWVKGVNTIFDETACGSGTCAIGVAMSQVNKQEQQINVIQPSGETISTQATYDPKKGQVIASKIDGKVSILFDGEFTLPI